MLTLRCFALLTVVSLLKAAPTSNISSSSPSNGPQWSPAWTRTEIDLCDKKFSEGGINMADCFFALGSLPRGSTYIRYANNAPWPYRDLYSLPLMVTHGSCAIKFQASGRNAMDLVGPSLVPGNIREMAAWVIAHCVLTNKEGGFVTREIDNTRKYLINPSNPANFERGLRQSFPPLMILSLLIYMFTL